MIVIPFALVRSSIAAFSPGYVASALTRVNTDQAIAQIE